MSAERTTPTRGKGMLIHFPLSIGSCWGNNFDPWLEESLGEVLGVKDLDPLSARELELAAWDLYRKRDYGGAEYTDDLTLEEFFDEIKKMVFLNYDDLTPMQAMEFRAIKHRHFPDGDKILHLSIGDLEGMVSEVLNRPGGEEEDWSDA